jgi:hypothetical protein
VKVRKITCIIYYLVNVSLQLPYLILCIISLRAADADTPPDYAFTSVVTIK